MKAQFAAAVICILAGHLLAQPNKGSPKDKNKPADHTGNTVTLTYNQESAQKAEAPKSSPPHWYTSSEWWLVIVAALTAGFIGWQSRETARAAKATQLAAESAEKSANAWMNGERAWIFSEVHDMKRTYIASSPIPVLTSFQFHFTNHGKTPGRILRSCVNLETITSIEALPLEPMYRAIQDAGPFQTPITTGQFHTVFAELSDHFGNDKRLLVSEGELMLCWYGFTEYIDIFDRPHETRFCYKYTVIVPQGGGLPSSGLVKWGHPKYNRAT
jgi:hypothetical protein